MKETAQLTWRQHQTNRSRENGIATWLVPKPPPNGSCLCPSMYVQTNVASFESSVAREESAPHKDHSHPSVQVSRHCNSSILFIDFDLIRQRVLNIRNCVVSWRQFDSFLFDRRNLSIPTQVRTTGAGKRIGHISLRKTAARANRWTAVDSKGSNSDLRALSTIRVSTVTLPCDRIFAKFWQTSEKVRRYFSEFFSISIGAKDWKSCRSQKMLQNEYLAAEIGIDTAENEPFKVS